MAFYNCLLIDIDDTLLDFSASEEAAFANTMSSFFPDESIELSVYREINNTLWGELECGRIKQDKLVTERFSRLFKRYNVKADAVKVNEYYLNQLSQHGFALDGAAEALSELAEVATIAGVTNGIDIVQRGRMSAAGLAQYFDDIFVSSAVGAVKPSRKIYDTALKVLGITNRQKVLVVGDSLNADVKGGINAQLDTCWCNFKDEPMPNGIKPTHTVHSYAELLRIVMDEEELQNVGSSEKRHKL